MVRKEKKQEVLFVNENKKTAEEGNEMYHKKAPEGLKEEEEKKKRTRSARNIETMRRKRR